MMINETGNGRFETMLNGLKWILLTTGPNEMFVLRRDQVVRDAGDVLSHRVHKRRLAREQRRREYRSRLRSAEGSHYRCRGNKVFNVYLMLTVNGATVCTGVLTFSRR